MVGYEKDAEVQLGQSDYALAAAVAGIVSRFLSQPLDVLKVKFQLQVEPIKHASNTSKYKAFGQAVGVIWKEEGLRAFWSGHNPGQLLSITYGVINFTTFELLTKVSQERLSFGKSARVDFMCGIASGSLATITSYPFDTLRTRFIAQGTKYDSSHSYRSMASGLVKMMQAEGVRAPFKGLLPALMQGAPLIGVSFTTHRFVKSILDQYDTLTRSTNHLNLSGNMIAGAVAGFVSKTSIYPLDLVRRRMQFQGFQSARIGYGENFTCWGLLDCLRSTVRKEGIRALFKGYVPSVVKTSVSTSMYFTVYEEFGNFMRFLRSA